jgi:predicted dehydrogenase
MSTLISRRRFLKRSAVTAGGLWLAGRSFGHISPNEKLNLGIIGTANRAASDLEFVSTENIVALCDVDANYLAAAQQKYPKAKTYRDFRKMLERTDLDAVVVGTPDHTHAVATVAAMESGRHVYCEKPLAHTVSEARRISEVAKKHKRVTQMGTQIHATNNYHRVVQQIQSGVIGPVREVHVWVETVYTGDGLPAARPPIPAGLDWDLWLGPAEPLSYSPEYVPRHWRCWWDFGGGTMSDFGCHYIDLPQWALGLRYPLSVETEGPPVSKVNPPAWMIARYEYPARGESPSVKLTWYQGIKDGQKVRPPQFAEGKLPEWGNGVLFVGDKGMLLAEYFKYRLLPEKDFPTEPPDESKHDHDYERKHHQEWIHAIKTGGTTSCNFDYSGALAESVLLGNAAFRSGQKIVWDPATLQTPGNPLAQEYIHHHYRAGWKI